MSKLEDLGDLAGEEGVEDLGRESAGGVKEGGGVEAGT